MSDQLARSSRIYGEMWKEIGIYALIQFSRHEIGMNSGLLGAALLVSVIQLLSFQTWEGYSTRR